MKIEEIVKLRVPFLGSGKRVVHKDGKHVTIPRDLCKIYELRQRKRSCNQCISFIAPGKNPVVAIITDVPVEVEGENHEYELIRISKFGRILLPKKACSEVPMDRRLTFVGRENYIEIRASNGYEED